MNTTAFNPDLCIFDPASDAYFVMSLEQLRSAQSGENMDLIEFALQNGETYTLSSGEMIASLEHSVAPRNSITPEHLVAMLKGFCWRHQLKFQSADEVLACVAIEIEYGRTFPKRGDMIEWLRAYIAEWDLPENWGLTA